MPLRLLHVSDIHLLGDGERHYGIVDTEAALRRVLTRAGEGEPPDVVVLSGDLSEHGTAESYELLRSIVEPYALRCGAVTVCALGNHDHRCAFAAVLGATRGVVGVRGYRVVWLDSSVPGAAWGRLDAEQLDWLRHVLAEPSENGTVVVVHHPPVPAVTPLLASMELENPDALMETCAAGDVRLVLSGHYHYPLVTTAGPITVSVAPGVANTTDVLATGGRERAVVGSAFGVVRLPAGGPATVSFVAAPSPDDGAGVFDLGPGEVARIAATTGNGATAS